jgi:hypothetical protein
VGGTRKFTFGNYSLRLAVGRGRSDDDQEVGTPCGHDVARFGGRHVTLSLRHRSWEDLTDSERWARLHEHL